MGTLPSVKMRNRRPLGSRFTDSHPRKRGLSGRPADCATAVREGTGTRTCRHRTGAPSQNGAIGRGTVERAGPVPVNGGKIGAPIAERNGSRTQR
jgi:hypothetical protein